MGPSQKIQYGEEHKRTTLTTNKAPSNLFALLWLLKYSIHDKTSHRNLVTFLAPNTFSKADVFPSFLTINFFIHYSLYPVSNIMSKKLDNDNSPVSPLLLEYYVKDSS
jgi:hypothetical protein